MTTTENMPDRNREETMTKHRFSRREVLSSATALAATVFASPLRAATPEASAITPALVEAAKKEGKLAFYTAMDLAFAERLAKTFEERFPGVAVRVERSGAERIFTRIAQEYGGNINVVDVVNTADQAHCIVWKRNGWLVPYLPEEVAKHFDPQYYDPDALHVTTRILISPIAYNTSLVKKDDAPKSFADLLDPRWAGKLVKGHPAYSGTIMNSTFQTARDLGWGYFEKLAKQRVLQVQSASARSWSTAPAISSSATRRRASRWRSSTPRKGRRSLPVRARYSRRPPIRTRRACSRIGCTRARPSNSWSIGPVSIRRIARPWRSPAFASSPISS